MKRTHKSFLDAIFILSMVIVSNAFSKTITRNRTVVTTQEKAVTSRRDVLSVAFTGIGLSGSFLISPGISSAVDKSETIIWKSGKAPIIPGQKPKDGNDMKGTRKDPDFLRSVSTCKSQCENALGSDGYAKSKEECLSDCQDICCTTYEQCTFAIVPRA